VSYPLLPVRSAFSGQVGIVNSSSAWADIGAQVTVGFLTNLREFRVTLGSFPHSRVASHSTRRHPAAPPPAAAMNSTTTLSTVGPDSRVSIGAGWHFDNPDSIDLDLAAITFDKAGQVGRISFPSLLVNLRFRFRIAHDSTAPQHTPGLALVVLSARRAIAFFLVSRPAPSRPGLGHGRARILTSMHSHTKVVGFNVRIPRSSCIRSSNSCVWVGFACIGARIDECRLAGPLVSRLDPRRRHPSHSPQRAQSHSQLSLFTVVSIRIRRSVCRL